MNMIERVARAICAVEWPTAEKAMKVKSHDMWVEFVPTAIAAIDAMREPSESMIATQVGNCPVDIGRQWLRDDAYSTWTTMIDASLQEK